MAEPRRPGFRLHADAERAATLHLDEGIGGWGVTARALRRQLDALGELHRLDVHLHSEGGDVFEGLAVFHLLAEHPARVVVHVDGVAASIASVVAMAGDEIRIAANGWLMIHEPRVSASGFRAEDCRRWASNLERMSEQFVAAYRRHCTFDDAELRTRLAAETWFTAEEALACGLAHQVTGAVETAARLDLRAFDHVPEGVRALFHRQETAMSEPRDELVVDVADDQEPTTPEPAVSRVEAFRPDPDDEPPPTTPAPTAPAPSAAAACLPSLADPAVAAALQRVAPGLVGALHEVQGTLRQMQERTARAERREVETRVDGLVRSGQVPPAERDGEIAYLASLGVSARDARFELLARRPRMLAAQVAFETGDGDDARRVTVDPEDFTSPGGFADPEALRLIARARAEGGDDPARRRAALYRLAGEAP